jgi:hypothetical protein
MPEGILFVTSYIINPSKTTDEAYNRFYNDEHLPDVISSGGTTLGLRYKNTKPATETDMPYLALYPVDTQWLGSPEHNHLITSTKKSPAMQTEDRNELVKFDSRFYEKIQTFEGYDLQAKSNEPRGQTIVCVAIEPGDEKDFDAWYRTQHLDMLSMIPGYRRGTRYRRIGSKKPTYLAIHEYTCKPDAISAEMIAQVSATEWSKKVISEAKAIERDVFELIEVQGEKGRKL